MTHVGESWDRAGPPRQCDGHRRTAGRGASVWADPRGPGHQLRRGLRHRHRPVPLPLTSDRRRRPYPVCGLQAGRRGASHPGAGWDTGNTSSWCARSITSARARSPNFAVPALAKRIVDAGRRSHRDPGRQPHRSSGLHRCPRRRPLLPVADRVRRTRHRVQRVLGAGRGHPGHRRPAFAPGGQYLRLEPTRR